MSPVVLLVIYCGAILGASLLGGSIPHWIKMTHSRLEPAVSFVAGVMLGMALLHLLPHAISESASVDSVVSWALVGILVMFFVERFFHYHTHDEPAVLWTDHDSPHDTHRAAHGAVLVPTMGGLEMSWGGAAVGLTLHSLIEGFALAASVQAEWRPAGNASLAGFGTLLVIVLHKPFDSFTLGTLMAAGGWPPRARQAVNALFALVVPLGVIAFHAGAQWGGGMGHGFLVGALAFSAGTFLCIAMSDLLPELHFHRHDRIKLSACLLAGLALAWFVGMFETHGHAQKPAGVAPLDAADHAHH